MVEEKPVEKPYSLNKFRIPKKKSIDSSDTESDKQVNTKTEVVEKSKKAEKAVVEESKQPLTASKFSLKKLLLKPLLLNRCTGSPYQKNQLMDRILNPN